ncbi:unnamed protein product [Owenia fusiformis]|uniref:Uncharacterized protein n=1 Tax=Owenia fusiformis TaxID=6347 RepID=A0A8J1TE68_OWEFU|nr:unnamed protein product [Owenia fusiformis]
MPSYKLTYFNGRGRAEIVRFVLLQAGVTYEDNRIEFETWGKMKKSGVAPFSQLPILELGDGTVLSQSGAIARFIAKQNGLAGKDLIEQALVDSIMDSTVDIFNTMAKIYFEKDEGQKATLKKKFIEDTFPTWETNIGKILQQNASGWLVGKALTLADLAVFRLVDELKLSGGDAPTVKSPLLKQHASKVAELPKIAKWLKDRPKSDF